MLKVMSGDSILRIIVSYLFMEDKFMRQGVRKHYFDEDYFEIIDNEEKAYWLGFIAADGCIIKSSEYNSYRLYINISDKDKSHLELFQKCIKANDIKIQTYVNTEGYSSKDGTVTSRIVLNSYKMCMDLKKYNIHERKSYDIQFPDIREDLKPHFLRGYFDGDGCFCVYYSKDICKNRVSFEVVGASNQFMVQVQDYLKQNDIQTNIYQRKSNSSYRLMTCSKKQVLKLIDFLYQNSSICLDRKLKKNK